MSPSKVQKTVDADVQDAVFNEDDVLRLVFSFVGCDQYLYLCINRRWKDAYTRVCCEAAAATEEKADMDNWYWALDDRGEACYWPHRPSKATAATSYASAFASLSRLQMACAFDLQLSTNAALPKAAGRSADKQTLLWAKQNDLPWVSAVCEGAALEGRLDMLYWLSTQQDCPCDVGPAVLIAALQSCNVDLLSWLNKKFGYEFGRDAFSTHVSDDMLIESECLRSVAVLAWLQQLSFFSNGSEERSTLRYIEVAAARGWFDSVKYLYRTYDNSQEQSVIKHAVRSGNVGMVRYLVAAGCALPPVAHSNLLQDAVCSGSISMLEHVIEANLDQWRSAERTKELLDMAGQQGHLEIVQWLRVKQNADWPPSLWQIFHWHNGEHHVHCWPSNTMAYAIEHGCAWGPWPQRMCCDLAVGQRPAVNWAHAHGCPCGADCPMRKR
jgi:hypothetical protein